MNNEVIAAVQTQLNHERQNAQRYLYMSAGFNNMAYFGFSKFFKSQAEGEMGHADLLAALLISKGIMPEYQNVPAVILTVGVREYAQVAYQVELLTTEALKELYDVADFNGDHQVCALVNTMLVEQIEEENVALDFLTQVQRTDENGWETLDLKYSK